jgi:hypothetical protein
MGGSHRAAKGNQVKIPEPGRGAQPGGNAKELGDAGGGPEEGSLLFLTVACPSFFLTLSNIKLFFGCLSQDERSEGGLGKRVFEEEGQARSNNLGIGSPGDEVGRPVERPRLWGVRDAFVGP